MSSRQEWDALQDRLLRGEQGAEVELYERLDECAATCSPPDDRPDLLHDLFLTLTQALLATGQGIRLREIRNLRAYCCRVALNLVRRRCPKRKAKAPNPPRPLSEWRVPSEVAEPDSRLLRRELRDMICRCLDHLPRADARLLRMCDFEGLTVAAAAERLSTPEAPVTYSAAEARLKRARACLRSLLRDRGLLPEAPASAAPRHGVRWPIGLLLIVLPALLARLA